MTKVRCAFEDQTLELALDCLMPTKKLGRDVRKTPKYKAVLASTREVGVIEPLAVFPESGADADGRYLLLDGHIRLEVLRELGASVATCLVSRDDEAFTYNRQINRLSAIQEHNMILKAIARGVPPERIAAALEVDVERIRSRQRLLDGIAPEVAEMLKDRMVNQGVFPVLRKMKPIRQIEAAEMMVSSNRFTLSYARMILATTRPEQLAAAKSRPKVVGVAPEDLARMEREMEKLNVDYRAVEDSHGDTMITLVVAKGYINRLLGNPAIADYMRRFHGELADGLASTMEAIATDARTPQRE